MTEGPVCQGSPHPRQGQGLRAMGKQQQETQAGALGMQCPKICYMRWLFCFMTFNTEYLKMKQLEQLSFHSASKEDFGKGKH